MSISVMMIDVINLILIYTDSAKAFHYKHTK